MTYLIGQILFCLIIAFFLGLFAGWLLFQRRHDPTKNLQQPTSDATPDHEACQVELQKTKANLDRMVEIQQNLEQQLALAQREKQASATTEQGDQAAEVPVVAEEPEPRIDWETAYDVVIQKATSLQQQLEEKTEQVSAAVASPDADQPPINLFRAAPETRDDLERIKGIGPALHRMLNQLGIYQFQQIASFSDRDIHWVASNLKAFKSRVTQDNWVEQATKLQSEKGQN